MHHTELKSRRAALGLTQRQLATAIQVTPNTVARWERGEIRIDKGPILAFILDQMQRDRFDYADIDDWIAYAEHWIENQRKRDDGDG